MLQCVKIYRNIVLVCGIGPKNAKIGHFQKNKSFIFYYFLITFHSDVLITKIYILMTFYMAIWGKIMPKNPKMASFAYLAKAIF